ncbi:dihydrofolate reductase family protein [Saccharopolyspora sp. NPDC003752]
MTKSRTWHGKVFIATSLDGYIARHDGDIEWLTNPPEGIDHADAITGPDAPPGYDAFMASVDHIVMGRGTYEKVLTFGFWPYPDHHVLVLSKTLTTGDDRISLVRTVAETIQTLNENNAKAAYIDGGQVVQEFFRHDLIDELTITRAPVLLGAGKPLFGTLPRDVLLRHRGTSTSESGMTHSTYQVVKH